VSDDEFEVAVRKLIYDLADVDPDDPEDDPSIFEAVKRAEQRVADLEQEVQEARRDAEISRATSKAIDDGTRADGAPTKKDRALWLSRDECVRRALVDGGSVNTGGMVTTTDVKDMAKPQTKLYHQTIADAWDELMMRHDEFDVVDPEDKPKRLQVDVENLTTEVVNLVEDSLGRDGLTKRLLSHHRGK
jgi:hypothetical protein